MERDILKKQPRTLRRSRCPVRDDEETAAQLSFTAALPGIESIGQRLLRLDRQAIIEVGPAGSQAGGRDKGGTPADETGLRRREVTV
jgi:hypothetical protein